MNRKMIRAAAVSVLLTALALGPAQAARPAHAGGGASLTRDYTGNHGLTNCPDGSTDWCVMNASGDEVANTVHVDGSFTPPQGQAAGEWGDASGGVSHRYRVRGTDTVTGKFNLTVTKRDIEEVGSGYAYVIARFCVTSGFDNSCEFITVEASDQPCTLQGELTLTKDGLRYAWQSISLLGYAGKASDVATTSLLEPIGSTGSFDADGTLAMEAFTGASEQPGITGDCATAPVTSI